MVLEFYESYESYVIEPLASNFASNQIPIYFSQCDQEDRARFTRVECANCTQYIWGQRRRVPYKMCAVCALYQK